jgi:hypothetical protein
MSTTETMVEKVDAIESRSIAARLIKIRPLDPDPLNLPAGPLGDDTMKMMETEKAVIALTTLVVIAAVPAVIAAVRAAMETVAMQTV